MKRTILKLTIFLTIVCLPYTHGNATGGDPVLWGINTTGFAKSLVESMNIVSNALQQLEVLKGQAENLKKLQAQLAVVNQYIYKVEYLKEVTENLITVSRLATQSQQFISRSGVFDPKEYAYVVEYYVNMIVYATKNVQEFQKIIQPDYWQMSDADRLLFMKEKRDSSRKQVEATINFADKITEIGAQRRAFNLLYSKRYQTGRVQPLQGMSAAQVWYGYSSNMTSSPFLPSTLLQAAFDQPSKKESKPISHKEAITSYNATYRQVLNLVRILTACVGLLGLLMVIRKITLGEEIFKTITVWGGILFILLLLPQLFAIFMGIATIS